MLTAPQLGRFYADLRDPELQSALAVVHSRFSTNTFPSWELAQPLRLLAHNGEINTINGNIHWMRAREAALRSELFGDDLERCLPLIPEGSSDSSAFDRVLELLLLAGRSLPHAMMMMIPAAHAGRDDIPPELEGFYRYSASVLEPWDGPAAMAFSDGRTLGACLDRNGLRPGRWLVTDEGIVVIGSEAGVLPVDPAKVRRRGRLLPGRLLVVDLERGRLFADGEAELEVARAQPYGAWCEQGEIRIERPPRARAAAIDRAASHPPARLRLLPGGSAGADQPGCRGRDRADRLDGQRPRARRALGARPVALLLLQAALRPGHQPADRLGARVDRDEPRVAPRLGGQPARRRARARRAARPRPAGAHQRRARADGARRAPVDHADDDRHDLAALGGEAGLSEALDRICAEAHAALDGGANLIVLSDRSLGADRVPIPSLLGLGAVHHDLVRAGRRLQTALVVESGEPREIHHLAALIGFGAVAVNPYLMFESLTDLHGRAELPSDLGHDEALERLMAAIRKGLLKVISKMGIATIQSYCGAQIFEAVGLDRDVIDRCFTGTPSAVGGVGLGELAREALERHARAYPEQHHRSLPEHVEDSLLPAAHASLLPQGGVYAWRRDGERHAWDPATIAALQLAVRANGDGDRRAGALRGVPRARQRRERRAGDAARPARFQAGWRSRSRSMRSSRRSTSSSASPPAA